MMSAPKAPISVSTSTLGLPPPPPPADCSGSNPVTVTDAPAGAAPLGAGERQRDPAENHQTAVSESNTRDVCHVRQPRAPLWSCHRPRGGNSTTPCDACSAARSRQMSPCFTQPPLVGGLLHRKLGLLV